MSKQLKFTYQDKEYCLEYTRKSVTTMEKNGFTASDIQDKPMTTLPALFAGAFLANHRFVKQDVIDEIFSKMTNKSELIGKLAEMYNEPIITLIDEPNEDEGNVDWTASW
jgi:hypothetical protein